MYLAGLVLTTATTVMQIEGASVETSWLQLLKQSPAGEDADVYANVCVCETAQQHSLLLPQRCHQQTLDHKVQQTQAVVATVGRQEY